MSKKVLISSVVFWIFIIVTIYILKKFFPENLQPAGQVLLGLMVLLWVLKVRAIENIVKEIFKRSDDFYKLSYTKYNPVAKEAFGRSLIDTGNSIFKGIILSFIVAPMALIFKSIFENKETESFISTLSKLPIDYFLLMASGLFLAIFARLNGLKVLNSITGDEKARKNK